ncbi:MAG: malate synthase A [Chloroflexi bacterium]|nr:malate synthase A [Chloroflexota bacterium]
MSHLNLPAGVEILGPLDEIGEQVLTKDALNFIVALQREFNQRRIELLEKRVERQMAIDAGRDPTFLAETAHVRNDPHWRVAAIPADLERRHIEITGPTDKKMLINALNSGADLFMADFEDANAPTWSNMLQGQSNLTEAIERTIFLQTPEKEYRLNDKVATLMARPRGWHLEEKHLHVDGRAMSGALFDFGLYFFRNARRLLARGTGPYFYLPKLESHLEARLWNDVFVFAQNYVGLPTGAIKVTVLIETILAAFEMEEILYELREHIAGLNAGRWDYIFSCIKKFRARQNVLFPDRAQVTMTAPFMRAYTELLVRTCHKRGAHAMGGMAAFIPSRKDLEVNANALAKVREDKLRESKDGFDGTWIAHPDLAPTVREVFDAALGEKANQKERLREDVNVIAAQLIDFTVPGGKITAAGVRNNISVAIQYMEAWLRGNGAVALNNLMEDAATAEIARSQMWQWIHHNGVLDDGRRVTRELYRELFDDEVEKIKLAWGGANVAKSRLAEAALLFDQLVTAEQLSDFMTLPAYAYLD